MNEQKMDHYTRLQRAIREFLNRREAVCQARGEQLLKEARKDEADFEKIKINIYHIMGILMKTAEEQAKSYPKEEQEEVFLRSFVKKAEQVSEPWKRKYEAAEQQKDPEHILIESLKLKTAAEVLEFIKNREDKDYSDDSKMEEN